MESNSGSTSIIDKARAMQERHAQILRASGVMSRMALAATASNRKIIEQGKPIVLGSEFNGIRLLLLAVRTSETDESVSAQYFTVGRQLDGKVALPNDRAGITDEDYVLIDQLFVEALSFQQDEAPNYSLESGLLQ